MSETEAETGTVWLTTEQAAAYLSVTVKTLYDWRLRGGIGGRPRGPRSYNAGRKIRYKRSDLDRWIESTARPGDGEA